jgi:O-antigen/teichoic acid export membrane protein
VKFIPGSIYRRITHRPILLKIVGNIGWLFFDKVLRMGLGLIVGVWLARYLGPEQYGQLNYAIAFVALLGAFSVLGFNDIVVRDIVREPDSANVTIGTAFILQVFAGLFAVIIIIISITLLRSDDDLIRLMVTVLSFGLLFKSSEVIKYWFESQLQSKYVVWIEGIVLIFISFLKLWMILVDSSLMAFVWLSFIEAVLVSIGLFAIYAHRVGQIGAWKIRFDRAKSLLRDAWPLIVSGVAITIFMRIDQIMLGEMVGPETVGIYSAAAALSGVWYFIPSIIANSVFPSILKSKVNSQVQYLDRLQRLYNLMSIISIFIAVIFSFISGWIVIILFGSEFAAAGPVLSIQIWAGVFVSLSLARGRWILAENLQHIGYWYVILTMIFNVVGNYFIIPMYGARGAAAVTVFSQAFAAIVAPALFNSTRMSSIMLIRSFNPKGWLALLRDARVAFEKKDIK